MQSHRLSFSAEYQPEKDGEDDADNYAGRQGEIEGEVFSLDEDIARQTTDIRYLSRHEEQDTQEDYKKTDDDQGFAKGTEVLHHLYLSFISYRLSAT